MTDGRVKRRDAAASLGPTKEAVRVLEEQLRAAPFAAPERNEQTALHLGRARSRPRPRPGD
ncbi:MAG TPA: hypothetical protein VHJ79_01380 [Mycobacterium sp.]|nr:hypothetical protein [Mycobacterium sp.]